MRRRWKILIGALAALVVLLVVNALVTKGETKPAEVNVPGGKIVELPGADLQVVDRGPRDGSPVVLIHCFTCAIDWWDGVLPRLARTHRVIAMDLLGHGGSEKPTSGYTAAHQADLAAQILGRLDVHDAEVVGHSLGGSVAVALAERSPQLVNRVVIVDTAPKNDSGDLGLLAGLAFAPVIGDALWRVKPDFATRKGLEVAFAPGFDVPDAFVEDVNGMTYNAYHDSPQGLEDYKGEAPLDERMRRNGKPLMVIMGAEEQIIDEPAKRLAEYRANVPGAKTKLMQGVGHSPAVEAPTKTAALILGFGAAGADSKASGKSGTQPSIPQSKAKTKRELQETVQSRNGVRRAP